MSKWSDIYQKQMSKFDSLDAFIDNKISYKKVLIDIIKKYGNNTKKILEAGCGSGITSIYIQKAGYTVTGIDSDPDMVKLATSIADKQNSLAMFYVDDIKTLSTIKTHHDVIFSNGVMEHFSDSDIVSIVNCHLQSSSYVVISVPSDYFSDEQRMFGDERFMNTEKWHSILSKTQGKIIEEFHFDSDKPIEDKPQFIGFVLSSI